MSPPNAEEHGLRTSYSYIYEHRCIRTHRKQRAGGAMSLRSMIAFDVFFCDGTIPALQRCCCIAYASLRQSRLAAVSTTTAVHCTSRGLIPGCAVITFQIPATSNAVLGQRKGVTADTAAVRSLRYQVLRIYYGTTNSSCLRKESLVSSTSSKQNRNPQERSLCRDFTISNTNFCKANTHSLK